MVLLLEKPGDLIFGLEATAVFILVMVISTVDDHLDSRSNYKYDLSKLLDKLADLLTILFTICVLYFTAPLVVLTVVLFTIREIVVIIVNYRAIQQGVPAKMVTSHKIKIILQSITIVVLLISLSGTVHLLTVAVVILVASALFALGSVK
jgi:phosphatidylglycerophosphate synthase